jgi:cytoskeleton-associated protein 5
VIRFIQRNTDYLNDHCSEAYILVGDKIWTLVGPLSPKDKTQLEERLRRVSAPASQDAIRLDSPVQPQVARLTSGIARPTSPASHLPRAANAGPSSTARVMSPPPNPPTNPRPVNGSPPRSASPPPSGISRPKSMLPSRLGPSRGRPNIPTSTSGNHLVAPVDHRRALRQLNGGPVTQPTVPTGSEETPVTPVGDDVSITISSILSHDPSRSVDALKKIQRILEISPEDARRSPSYVELSEHTEGLVETITLQMGHVFERPEAIAEPDNFRLAKHLIQTLNAFCDHPLLAESLSVDIVTALLEELTARLLQTDDSHDSKVKDLSRFINMIILRLFATGRRIVIFRYDYDVSKT